MTELPQSIGWIGLGVMGCPMASNLLKKMDSATLLYVFDVAKAVVDKFVEEGDGRVFACQSSKEVADKSVRIAEKFRHTSTRRIGYGASTRTNN